jgi:hypothetical protein
VADRGRALDTNTQAVERHEASKGETAAARVRIASALDAALTAARLDVIVANLMGRDPVAIAEWTRRRRMPYRARETMPETPTGASATPEVETAPTPELPASTDLPACVLPAMDLEAA